MARPGNSAILAALKSCLARDRSWVLRLYAPVGVGVAGFAVLLMVLAFPNWVAEVQNASATLLLGPGLLVLGGLGVAGGAVAPLLLAARRLPEAGRYPRHERSYGGLGFGFVLAVYLGFVISAPPEYRTDPTGPFGEVISWLYGLDPLIGMGPPIAILVVLLLYDRLVVP